MKRRVETADLNFERCGAELRQAVFSPDELLFIKEMIAPFPTDRPGVRLTGHLNPSRMGDVGGKLAQIASEKLGAESRPVRATLFDKSAANNWALGWHQDRTIAVRDRVEIAGYGPWGIKAGVHHVAPPAELLARMITMRVHLDQVDAANAPLLIALGSHRSGLVDEDRIEAVVSASDVHECLAEPGDVWLYSTLILHASSRAKTGHRRRVLQIDYSADALPGGLEWIGLQMEAA